MSTNQAIKQFLPAVLALSRQAGLATLPYFHREKEMQQQQKQDHSVLTQADLISDAIVREKLQQIEPAIPILTEETVSQFPWSVRQQWTTYWLVDPLDGTRGFAQGDPFYTVNVALIVGHKPVLGVVYAPVSDELYYAVASNGAFFEGSDGEAHQLHTAPLDTSSMRAVTGHFCDNESHYEALKQRESMQLSHMNSSYKFCSIVRNQHDLYPKYTPTSEWDTAASQVIVQEAGGAVVNESGQPLTYNTKESLINPSFLAIGDASRTQEILQLIF